MADMSAPLSPPVPETHVVVARHVSYRAAPSLSAPVVRMAPLPRFSQVTGPVVDTGDGPFLQTVVGYLPLTGHDGGQLLARDKSAEDRGNLADDLDPELAARRGDRQRLHDEYGERYPPCHLTTKLIGDRVGVGLQVLFSTLKWYGLVMLALAAAAVPPLVLNAGGYQADRWTNSSALSRLSLGNVALDPGGADDVKVEAGLDFLVVAGTVVLMVVLNQRNWAAEISTDARNETAADHAVFVDGLPPETTGADVWAFAAAFSAVAGAASGPFEIVQDMTFACRDARWLVEARSELELERARQAQYRAWGWTPTETEAARLQRLESTVEDLERESATAECSGGAVIVFRQAAHADAVLDWVGDETGCQAFGGSLVCCGADDAPAFHVGGDDLAVQVRRAAEPSEIDWRHFGVPLRDRLVGSLASYLMSGVAIAAAAVASWQLEAWARDGRECPGSTDRCPELKCGQDQPARLAAVAVVTAGLNTALRTLVTWATDYELARSRTGREVSLLRKLSVAYVSNTVLIYWFVVDRDQWYVAGGLAELATLIAVANALAQPLMLVLQPTFYVWRWWAARRAPSQADLDLAYLPWDFDLAEAYALVIKTLAVALLFGQIAPLIYPVTAVALALLYWSLKYTLARHSRHPPAYTAAARDTFRTAVALLLIGHVVVSAVVYRDETCAPRYRRECGGEGRACGSQLAGLLWVGAGAVLAGYLAVPVRCYPDMFRPAPVDYSGQRPFPRAGLETQHRELQDGPGSWSYRLPSP